MSDDTWARAARIAAIGVASYIGGYLAVLTLVRFIVPNEWLFLVVAPTAGVLGAWVYPLLLGQVYRSWKVAWSTFLFSLLAAPLVLMLLFGVFFATATPR